MKVNNINPTQNILNKQIPQKNNIKENEQKIIQEKETKDIQIDKTKEEKNIGTNIDIKV